MELRRDKIHLKIITNSNLELFFVLLSLLFLERKKFSSPLNTFLRCYQTLDGKFGAGKKRQAHELFINLEIGAERTECRNWEFQKTEFGNAVGLARRTPASLPAFPTLVLTHSTPRRTIDVLGDFSVRGFGKSKKISGIFRRRCRARARRVKRERMSWWPTGEC